MGTGTYCLTVPQIHQPQFLQVLVEAPALWSSKGPLAPSPEMSYQAKSKKAVDLTEKGDRYLLLDTA